MLKPDFRQYSQMTAFSSGDRTAFVWKPIRSDFAEQNADQCNAKTLNLLLFRAKSTAISDDKTDLHGGF
ncbi:MAG: hypothetical protein IKI77_06930 [Oscillospiraceae bacterium]|nr:hypothetical protein [Oscillospiraceae bacterium]